MRAEGRSADCRRNCAFYASWRACQSIGGRLSPAGVAQVRERGSAAVSYACVVLPRVWKSLWNPWDVVVSHPHPSAG